MRNHLSSGLNIIEKREIGSVGDAPGEDERPVCFVIGPIGNANADIGTEARTAYEQAIQVLEHVVEPACDVAGLRPVRADRISRAGEIPEQVCRMIRDAPVVIADLSGANPNVMYELGLRHTKQLLTVQIGEVGRLPFDVHAIRTIEFRRSESGLIQARDALIEELKEGLAGHFDPVTATRVWHEPLQGPAVDAASVEVPAEEDGEPGVLERLVGMEEALPEVTTVMQEVSAATQALTAKMNEVQVEVAASDARGGGAAARLSIAARFSMELDEAATQMEELAERYETQMRAIDPGVSTILSELEQDPSKVERGVVEFLETLVQLGPVFSEFVDITTANAENMAQLGRIAIPLRRPSRRYSEAILRLSRAGVAADNWSTRAARLLAPE